MAGLASVASPPVVALGNVHADVHGVVTCQNTTEEMQVRLRSQEEIKLIPNAGNPYHCLKDNNNGDWLMWCAAL